MSDENMKRKWRARARSSTKRMILEKFETILTARSAFQQVDFMACCALGKMIADLREETGATQQDVADRIYKQLGRTRKGTASMVHQAEKYLTTIDSKRLAMILMAIPDEIP